MSLILTHGRAGGKAQLYIMHPPHLKPFVEKLTLWFKQRCGQGDTFLSLEIPASYFKSVAAYSSLLLSSRFYLKIARFEWLFIVQLDALLLGEDLEAWLDSPFSYIGAPWFVGLDKPRQPLQPLGGGNGGFSLRRIADCLKVLEYRGSLFRALREMELTTLPHQRLRAELRSWRYLFQYAGSYERLGLYEDIFWSFVAPHLNPSFSVAPFSVSCCFAFETEPRYVLEQARTVPFGCHAFNRYDPEFWCQYFQLNSDILDPFRDQASNLLSSFEAV